MRAHFKHLHFKNFQWYNEHFNPMNFDLCNHSLKIWEYIGTPTPKVGSTWECGFIPSHPPTLPGAKNVTPGPHSRPTLLQALTLIMSPRLGSRQGT